MVLGGIMSALERRAGSSSFPTGREAFMDWRSRIVIDPKILVGKPVIRGTRISVEFVVDLLAAGWSHEQVLESYPHISEQDIRACLAYAGELLREEQVYPLTTA
jgi:uncharacterized protein (DUF433 family)